MKYFIFLCSFLSSMVLFCQEEKEVQLLKAKTTWGKEIITMPIHFAPQIPYKGVEELRFSPDWSKQDRDGYWSYAFVWDIDLDTQLTANDIETYLQYYFDGLMDGVNKDKDKILPKTIALVLKKKNNENEFFGKLQVYNSFHTKDVMQLYCTVIQYYCAEKQKSMVLFRFSPKPLQHAIWKELNKISIKKKPCED